MLVKIKEGTYLNIRNVSYIDIETKDFSYTTMGSNQLNFADFDFASREELITLFESDNAKQFLGLSNDDSSSKIYVNVETIEKVDYSMVDEGIKISIWFINDENSCTFHIKEKEGFVDKLVKEINAKLGEIKPQYVDHFQEKIWQIIVN